MKFGQTTKRAASKLLSAGMVVGCLLGTSPVQAAAQDRGDLAEQCIAGLASNPNMRSLLESDGGETIIVIACESYISGFQSAVEEIASNNAERIHGVCREVFGSAAMGSSTAADAARFERALDRLNLSAFERLDAVNRCDAYRVGMIDGLQMARGFLAQ